MPDDQEDVPALDLTSPFARHAIADAFRLVAAARGSAVPSEQAWATYVMEIDRVARETLRDPRELSIARLAWALHGMATVAGAASHVAALASEKDELEIDTWIQRTIDERVAEGGGD
jgi:hypothetical protein